VLVGPSTAFTRGENPDMGLVLWGLDRFASADLAIK
jgi:hypothetical protein